MVEILFGAMEKISKRELKKLILRAQGFLRHEEYYDTEKVINDLGYIQIDTINVTQRAHHHILYTRSRSYSPENLQMMMKEKQVFEYWSHAASILPISSYRYSLLRKKRFNWQNSITRSKEFKEILPQVYDRVKKEGALTSKDFDDKPIVPGEMWYVKLSRLALEFLFHQGKLMIKERINFRKVYDLTERVFPAGMDMELPAKKEAAEYQLRMAVSSLGAVSFKDASEYLCIAGEDELFEAKKRLLGSGELKEVECEDFIYLVPAEQTESLGFKQRVFILSPFDNLIINRKRLKRIFDFDFKLECYIPAKKRKFGFFAMPLLYEDRFIGMIDLKAERKKKNLIIKNLILWEKLSLEQISLLKYELEKFAVFNECTRITGKQLL